MWFNVYIINFSYNYHSLLNDFYINYLNIDFNLFTDTSNFSLYHYSIPNVKLYYPEPFIASPTFMHDDIWFVHIVIYQYWLWFFFIFLIVFFFLSFLIALRWCNIRFKPVRETRGVSRSKCGDLITATVPVSWATSIIIHESTDAIEFADGFGTTEIAVGIRAYQWGWEYYYPRDLDLNYMYSDSSFFLGNSLFYKYNQENSSDLLKWKNNILDNSSLSTSNFSFFLSIKSLTNKYYSFLNNYFNFNTNKLITNYSSDLITSTKLLFFIDNLYTNDFFIKNKFFSTYTSTQKYSFNSIFLQKPYYNYFKYNFLTNLASFSYINQYSTFKLFNSTVYLDKNFFNSLDLLTVFFSLNTPFLFVHNLNYVKENAIFSKLSKYDIFYNNLQTYNNSTWLLNSFLANQDFKRWLSNDLFEDFFFNDDSLSPFLEIKNSNFLPSNYIFTNLFTYTFLTNYYSNYLFRDILILPLNYIYFDLVNTSSITFSFFKNINYWSDFSINSWNNLQFHFNYLNKQFSTNFIFNTIHFFRSISFFEFLVNYESTLNKNFTNITSAFNSSYIQTSLNFDFININKNLNTYNQAFTKVFKSSVEEERLSNLFSLLSKSFNELLFISKTPTPLLSNIQKNNNFFINTILYKPIIQSVHNTSTLNQIFDFFILKFPFLISIESDAIRYSWLDWYSVRNAISTKALDTSVFDLHGSKYYSYSFYNSNTISFLNQTDNFFNKYVQARKLYIPLAIYTPLFFNKFLYNYTYLFLNNFNYLSSFHSLYFFYLYMYYFDNTFIYLNLFNFYNYYKNNTSNSTSYIQFTYTSLNNFYNKFNVISRLIDILTKREFLYKKYLLNFNTKQFFSNNNNYLVSDSNSIFLLFKSFDKKSSTYTLNNDFTYKMQYVPLRKGITNMIRIQADKAVALPTDIRIQILAVSKDIIHSWSVPSAGIKIDCIPGYSSHKVVIFLLSGIYWGQCMEICGRFHHWMPIVVYFMKRDLFCIWCLHFIFKKKQNNIGVQNLINLDKEFFSNVTYSYNTWFYNF